MLVEIDDTARLGIQQSYNSGDDELIVGKEQFPTGKLLSAQTEDV